VSVTTGSGGLFDYSTADYAVYLDKKQVFKASNLANATTGMFCLYFIFQVHYALCEVDAENLHFFVIVHDGLLRATATYRAVTVQQVVQITCSISDTSFFAA
jgi:hypothetical protein